MTSTCFDVASFDLGLQLRDIQENPLNVDFIGINCKTILDILFLKDKDEVHEELTQNDNAFIVKLIKEDCVDSLKKVNEKYGEIIENIYVELDLQDGAEYPHEQLTDWCKFQRKTYYNLCDRMMVDCVSLHRTPLLQSDLDSFSLACIFNSINVLDYFIDELDYTGDEYTYLSHVGLLRQIFCFTKKGYGSIKIFEYLIDKCQSKPDLWSKVIKYQTMIHPCNNYTSKNQISYIIERLKNPDDEDERKEDYDDKEYYDEYEDVIKLIYDQIIDRHCFFNSITKPTIDDVYNAFMICPIFYLIAPKIEKKDTLDFLEDLTKLLYPDGLYQSRFFQPEYKEKYDLVTSQISTIPPCKIGKMDFVGQEYIRAQERFNQNC